MLLSDKGDFKPMLVRRDKESNYTLVNVAIH
jgi:hypothetical protein